MRRGAEEMSVDKKVKTVTREDLSHRVVEEMGFSQVLAHKLVGDVIDEMRDCLGSLESLRLTSFASFNVYKRRPRKGMNLRTGQATEIGERYVIQFKSSESLRERVERGL